jgi:predicted dehydrogenase
VRCRYPPFRRNVEKFPEAKQYRDFRKMFDEMEKNIDAVVVATPDHTHAVAAMAAIKRGKHVYCEKPLAHSIYEVRQLMKAAQEHKVVTQLGNQGHSFNTIRQFREWIEDGAIGKVHTIPRLFRGELRHRSTAAFEGATRRSPNA